MIFTTSWLRKIITSKNSRGNGQGNLPAQVPNALRSAIGRSLAFQCELSMRTINANYQLARTLINERSPTQLRTKNQKKIRRSMAANSLTVSSKRESIVFEPKKSSPYAYYALHRRWTAPSVSFEHKSCHWIQLAIIKTPRSAADSTDGPAIHSLRRSVSHCFGAHTVSFLQQRIKTK